MKVQWLGHACFLITSAKGTRIITDPYTPGDMFRYGPVDEFADLVLVSHDHFDHNNVAGVKGKPQVVKGAGKHQAAGIDILGLATYHDQAQGSQRGNNTVFVFTVDGVRMCHLGDLGHSLSPAQLQEAGKVDVLFLPVGAGPTLSLAQAGEVSGQLQPKLIIPMHFQTGKVGFPLASAEDFLSQHTSVRRLHDSQVEVQPGQLPKATEVVLLQPAR